MSKFHLKKRSKGSADPVEINVTPMIDMFSVLNSFLLMTAVFSSTGQIRVEIPFLSSKPPPPQEELDKTPQKDINVTIDDKIIKLAVSFTNTTQGATKEEFANDENGRDALQGKLYDLRKSDTKVDKVTLFTENDTKYESLVKVLDALRVLKTGRAPLPWPADYKLPAGVDPEALIPKIVLGNVIL